MKRETKEIEIVVDEILLLDKIIKFLGHIRFSETAKEYNLCHNKSKIIFRPVLIALFTEIWIRGRDKAVTNKTFI